VDHPELITFIIKERYDVICKTESVLAIITPKQQVDQSQSTILFDESVETNS
jgi:hypothetical protein